MPARAVPRRHIRWSAYLYILPAFIILGAFHILPAFYALYISLNTGPINRFTFVGLANYIRALTGGEFWSALATTFVYALLTLPFTIALGLFFAYLLYQRVRWQGMYRTIFFLPYVISTVGSSIVYMFNQLYTYSNYGYAATVAVLLSLLILAFTLLNFRFLGRRVQY